MEKSDSNKRIYRKKEISVSFLNQDITCNLYVFGMVIFCCFGFFAVYLLNSYIKYADVITSLIWVVFLIGFLMFDPKFIVKYMYLMFLIITNLIGVFIIENSKLYLYELRANSKDYNSLWVLSWVHFIFFIVLYLFDKYFDDKIVSRMSKDKENWVFKEKEVGDIIIALIGCVFILVNVVSILLVLKNGTAHQLKIDRFEYSARFLHGFWGSLNNILTYIVPVIALLYLKKFKLIPSVMLGLYFVYLFLIGVKFGTFLTSVCFLLPVVFILNSNININKLVYLIIVLVILLIGVVFVFNSLVYKADLSDNITYLKDRGSQQGQLWWAVYGDKESKNLHIGEFVSDELSIIGNGSKMEEHNHGIYKVMRLTTPADVFDAKLESGSTYAYSTQASLFYYFNYIGLFVFDILGALLLSFFTNIYWGTLSGHRIIESVIVLKFVYNSYWVVVQSDITSFFSPKKLVYLVAAAFWGIVIVLRYRKISYTFSLRKKVSV